MRMMYCSNKWHKCLVQCIWSEKTAFELKKSKKVYLSFAKFAFVLEINNPTKFLSKIKN